jgi:hypothetical protein
VSMGALLLPTDIADSFSRVADWISTPIQQYLNRGQLSYPNMSACLAEYDAGRFRTPDPSKEIDIAAANYILCWRTRYKDGSSGCTFRSNLSSDPIFYQPWITALGKQSSARKNTVTVFPTELDSFILDDKGAMIDSRHGQGESASIIDDKTMERYRPLANDASQIADACWAAALK